MASLLPEALQTTAHDSAVLPFFSLSDQVIRRQKGAGSAEQQRRKEEDSHPQLTLTPHTQPSRLLQIMMDTKDTQGQGGQASNPPGAHSSEMAQIHSSWVQVEVTEMLHEGNSKKGWADGREAHHGCFS